MDKIATTGLIVNPVAGRGIAANAETARRSLAALSVRKVYTGSGPTGAAALKGLSYETVVYPVSAEVSRRQTLGLAEQLAQQSLDAVLVVGGDGTLADVAGVFSRIHNSPPLLGIGAGSTNAGTLITCPALEVDNLNPGRLEAIPATGLIAHKNGSLAGIGFNDCVLGFTVVATIQGRLRDVNVAEKHAQRNIPGRPQSIATSQTQVQKVGQSGAEQIAAGEMVGTVVIGLVERMFTAKAITGGVCLAALTGLQAGCLVADQPLVRIEMTPSEVLALPPIHSAYASFSQEEQILVRGLRAGTGLCIDGTPLHLLTPEDVVSFQVQPQAIRILKLVR